MNSFAENSSNRLQRWHIDLPLLIGLLCATILGLITLYSADGQDLVKLEQQAARLVFALFVMFALAQVNPKTYQHWSVPLYSVGVVMLVLV